MKLAQALKFILIGLSLGPVIMVINWIFQLEEDDNTDKNRRAPIWPVFAMFGCLLFWFYLTLLNALPPGKYWW